MNVVLDIDDFKLENVFFQDSVKNTVMDNSDFIRTLYSTELFTINGIFSKRILALYISRNTSTNTNVYLIKN